MLLVNSLLTGFIKAKHYSDAVPDVNNLEHEVEAEATIEPSPTSIEQDLPTSIEQELDSTHSNEPAAIEGSSKVVLDADATGGIELQSELKETLDPSALETRVDIVSSNKDALTAVVAREMEPEAEAERQETNAATTTNDFAAEFPVTEQPIIPTTEVSTFYSCGNVLLTRFYLSRINLPNLWMSLLS